MESTSRSGSSAHGDQSQVPALLVMTCSICFLSPTDPVVTSCGHMFCWPCLYLWLQRLPGQAFPCPVCRTELEKDVNLFPIYANYEPVDPGSTHSHAARPRGPGSDSDAIPPCPNPPPIARNRDSYPRRMRRNLRMTALRSDPPRAADRAAIAPIRHVDVEVHLDVEVSDPEYDSDSEFEVVAATAVLTYE